MNNIIEQDHRFVKKRVVVRSKEFMRRGNPTLTKRARLGGECERFNLERAPAAV
jgi:hypothetical protein